MNIQHLLKLIYRLAELEAVPVYRAGASAPHTLVWFCAGHTFATTLPYVPGEWMFDGRRLRAMSWEELMYVAGQIAECVRG